MEEIQEPKNALWRREEQLRRWNLSDTNKESAIRKIKDSNGVQFQDGCVFLAACSSGDRDEVEKLLGRGADINTANVDGLTALHQACIDDKLDMVQFLVEQGADIDSCDNEGWTALHATASCGFLDIAKYLIEQGANVAAVNNDGELAIDIAEGDNMEDLLADEMENLGLDADAARNEEEETMLRDAKQWINQKYVEEKPHAKTGATALHVAAAKGYINVINLLIQAGVDMDVKDNDGWTPLHAAAHWGQEEACKILVDNFCNMELKNIGGQTAFDVADSDLISFLKDLKQKQVSMKKDREADMKEAILSRGGPPPLKRRSSVTRMSVDQKQSVITKDGMEERQQLEAMRNTLDEKDEEKKSESSSTQEDSSSDSETEKQNEINSRQSTLPTETEENEVPSEKPPKLEKDIDKEKVTDKEKEREKERDKEKQRDREKERDKEKIVEKEKEIEKEKEAPVIEDTSDNIPPPRQNSHTPRISDIAKSEELHREADKENDKQRLLDRDSLKMREVIMRKDQDLTDVKDGKGEESEVPSFAPRPLSRLGMDKGPSSWRAGLRKTGSSSAVPESSTNNKEREHDRLARSASSPWLAPEKKYTDDISRRRPVSVSGLGDTQDAKNRFNDLYTRYSSLYNNKTSSTLSEATTSATSTTTTAVTTATTTAPGTTYTPYTSLSRRRQDEADSKSKSTSPLSTTTTTSTYSTTSPSTTSSTSGVRRSYEPPKRDEERETERKAKARRARETRRSTQGVTKEDLRKAEQTLQAASQGTEPPPDPSAGSDDKSDKENRSDDMSTSYRSRRHILDEKNEEDTRNSIRRNRDSGLSSTDSSSSYLRSIRSPTTTTTSTAPSSTLSTLSSSSLSNTSSSLTDPSSYRSSYRSKYLRDEDDKKEDEDPSQKSSAIRTRRKRESRRPTGKIATEDLQGIIKEDGDDNKTKTEDKKDKEEEKTSTSSRYGTSRYSDPTGSSLYDRTPSSSYSSRSDRPSSYSGSNYGTNYTRSYSASSSSLDKDIDYKKLYEDEKAENERLRKDLKKTQQELTENKIDLDKAKAKNDSVRAYDSSADKRERRALERKVSELEEELKAMENLKTDNQRLKEENGALIRVISKLSK